MKTFETTAASCAYAGPLTLLIYLRIAKLTHDQKEARRASTRQTFLSSDLDMQELCLLDLN